jgi:Zn-dependent membrane protease YugP
LITYLILVGPAILLALYAQWRVSSAYSQMSQVPARMTGAEAARRILNSAGLDSVAIESVPGHLSDHYDPTAKVVRLSHDVYRGNSMAAVGIAAHEVGHAIQDARNYSPLVIRNLAVPVAGFGSSLASVLFTVAFVMLFSGLIGLGKIVLLIAIIGFSAVVFFQLINLPVEFDASSRAKDELMSHGIISSAELPNVSRVLNAAALTNVAGTLSSVMTLAYYLIQYAGLSQSEA